MFASHGCRIVGLDRHSSPELDALAAEVAVVDVSDHAAIGSVAGDLSDRGFAPDVLVNNAGVTRDGVVWKLSEQKWDEVVDTCLKGAFNMTHFVVPMLRRKGGGCIINITSINGERGKFGQSNYAAAKAGVIGFTKACARDLGAHGIRVNAVSPGMVETEMAAQLPPDVREVALRETLLGRLASPEDIANAVLFLASPMSRHVTGHVLRVDGGQYL
jgi:NAD(P)-dependent dehydrogenase (short-subunit alcohol dehydrogenase family)